MTDTTLLDQALVATSVAYAMAVSRRSSARPLLASRLEVITDALAMADPDRAAAGVASAAWSVAHAWRDRDCPDITTAEDQLRAALLVFFVDRSDTALTRLGLAAEAPVLA